MHRLSTASRGLRAIASSMMRSTRSYGTSVALRDRILVVDGIEPVCAQILRDAGHTVDEKAKLPASELLSIIGNYHGLVVRSETKVTEEVLEKAGKLKVVGRAGTGVDTINVDACTKRGVLVLNTPGGNTTSTAELTMSLMMNMLRSVPNAVASAKSGKWERSKFMGAEAFEKTLGVIGCGRIGRQVAHYAQSFGMKPIGCDAFVTADEMKDAGLEKVDLETLLKRADVITIHTPGGKDTKNMIGKDQLALCKDGVYIVNAARGGLINEAALLEGLQSGKVAGAALDVFENEPKAPAFEMNDMIKALVAHPNVTCTPHLGASTEEAQLKVAHDIAFQIADGLERGNWVGVCNASHIAASALPHIKPYVAVSEAIGSLAGQIHDGDIKSVDIVTNGKLLGAPAVQALVKTSVLKGLLSTLKNVTQAVNIINAPTIAKENHIGCSITHNGGDVASSSSYANHIVVTITTATETRVVAGTRVGNDVRITQMDHWSTFPAFVPHGHMIFFNNIDRPGVVHNVITILADNNINIGSVGVGRHGPGSPALTYMSMDSRPSRAIVERISDLTGINNLRVASL